MNICTKSTDAAPTNNDTTNNIVAYTTALEGLLLIIRDAPTWFSWKL
jgi:hypothetical protein